jgi:hypothetical protein
VTFSQVPLFPNNTVESADIQADAITAAKIADNAISEEHLDVTAVTGHTAETSIADGDLVLIHDASASALRKMTKANFVSGIGGANTPAFAAHMAGDQNNNTDNTWTKIAMATEFFDSDGKYDASNAKFTPTVSGKYMFGCSLYIDANSTANNTAVAFYKNGSKLLYSELNSNNHYHASLTGIIDLDTDDYVELYGKVDVADNAVWAINADGTTANNRTFWYGYKLIT